MTSKTIKRWWQPKPWVTFSIVFVVFLLVSLLKLDNDFGWHLMSGNYIVHHGIPQTDIFTYTARDFHWINHEWLNDVIVYSLYNVGGFGLLAVVWAALTTGALWLVGRRYHGAVVILASVAIMTFVGVRSVVWTLLGIALLIYILRQSSRKAWWLLVPLFALWANLHGGFVVGIAYVLYRAVRMRSWLLGLLAVLGAASTLINPYGVSIYTEIFRTLFDPSLHAAVTEWRSFAFPYGVWPYMLLWSLGFILYSYKKPREYLRFDILMLIAAMGSVRNWALFTLFSMHRADRYVREIERAIPQKLDRQRSRILHSFMAATTLLTVACVVMISFSLVAGREQFPSAAADYLKAHPCSGNVFASYDYGGYLIWKLPGVPDYIDGRMPSWESGDTSYIQNYFKVLDNKQFHTEQFKKYNISCVVMPTDSGLVEQLRGEGWHTPVVESKYVLLEA